MNRKIFMTLITAALVMGATALSQAGNGNDIAGAVYTMTNAEGGNEVVVFERSGDGLLQMAGAVATDGLGSGVILDPLGSQGSVALSMDKRWLMAVNAGSNDVSVFRVAKSGLELVGAFPSGGEFPVSIAVFHDLVYVLNAGGIANISGFFLSYQGVLIPRADATRELGSGGFAQVGFDPQGNNLVVTDRDENEILVFPVDWQGLPAMTPVTSMSYGNAPFGFIFDQKEHLLVSEAGSGAVSSYAIMDDGSLMGISPSVANGQIATCWIAGNNMGYVFTANTGSQTLSAYVDKPGNGQLELLDATAGTGNRPIDMAVSVNGRFLYALDPAEEAIDMYKINADGSLTDLGTAPAGISIFAQGIAVR